MTLTGKEIRAYFNFSKLSLPSGLVTLLIQCCWQRTSCSFQWEEKSPPLLACSSLLWAHILSDLQGTQAGACKLFCGVQSFPWRRGGLKGHSSLSWANLLAKRKGPNHSANQPAGCNWTHYPIAMRTWNTSDSLLNSPAFPWAFPNMEKEIWTLVFLFFWEQPQI